MKFFIPSVGTTFKLDKPWTFLLYVERRNMSLFKAFGTNVEHLVWEGITPYIGWGYGNLESQTDKFFKRDEHGCPTVVAAARFVLPAGTVLKVKRLYVRSGQGGEFDSVTMSVRETSHPFLVYAGKTQSGTRKKSLGDFWVKLCDFNEIEGTVLEDNTRGHNGPSSLEG